MLVAVVAAALASSAAWAQAPLQLPKQTLPPAGAQSAPPPPAAPAPTIPQVPIAVPPPAHPGGTPPQPQPQAKPAPMPATSSLSDLYLEGFQKQTGHEGVKTQVHANPFESGVTTVESLSVEDLQLTGIVFASANDAYALISGYLVRPGDLIAGYRVEAIEHDKVKLDRVGNKYVLVLGGGLQ